ncbi:MAG: hypothetical protein A3I66_06365 [Burkholderiales bacterium RIFCSPLOWO2_02_FULL_57_36]|nr:MAG: hypothetical protein A3I66_06365 [Burkholderiales bacterium RIFCSPLOWO2_02_FULL_57_36]
MKPRFFSISIAMLAVFFTASAVAQTRVKPAPSGGGAQTIYRQVMPDGRIMYADRALPGARVDHIIKVDRPIKGNVWGVESGANPVAPRRAERTPVKRATVPPATSRKMSIDEATSEVIRAEMLLEDAKKQQEAGVEPLPGERTGTVSGGSRLNEAYHERQKLLAKYVSYAEAALKKAIEDWNRVR